MPEMFTDEHAFDYSSLPLYDEYDDDLYEVEFNTEYVYNDPFDSKGEKIKVSKLLIDELDLPRSSDFFPSPKYDSFLLEDFSEVPSTNNEDKNVKKIAISYASLILEDFDPPLYELRDSNERLTLNMRHDTLNYSNQPQKESINIINIYDDSSEDFLKDLFVTNHQSGNPTFSSYPKLTSPEVKDDIFDPERGNVLIEKLLDLDSTKDLHPPHNVNPLSGRTTSSSLNQLLEEFEMDSILEDSIDKDNLADLNKNLFDTMPEMFTDEHAFDYSSLPLYDEYDDDLYEVEFNTEYVYNDPFDSKGEKIKVSKLLIDELDLPRSSDFFPSPKYDSFLLEDFSEVPSTNNEDKNVKKIAISYASLILEDFDPPLYELPFFKEVLGFK
nr:hypothetical protein [Tanacetum cinerariifolium]